MPSKKIKLIERDLIKEVINEHIENKSMELRNYLVTNKSRWF